jgi:hypothetical protein
MREQPVIRSARVPRQAPGRPLHQASQRGAPGKTGRKKRTGFLKTTVIKRAIIHTESDKNLNPGADRS